MQKLCLTDEERLTIKEIASKGIAIHVESSRLFEPVYELKTGKPVEATRGLDHRLNLNKEVRLRIANGVEGIQQEVELLAADNSDPEHKEVLDVLHYILYGNKSSQKQYANGTLDQGRDETKLMKFITDRNAQNAHLDEPEVVALRLYSTLAYKFMNMPLRNEKNLEPCPLAVSTYYAASAIKKMRALHVGKIKSGSKPFILWRGMRNIEVASNFMQEGGTEFGFMSTTTDLKVAVRYSISTTSLLFKIIVSDFMSMGADLRWVSAFPAEAEILYPPLTFLKPTGRTENIDVVRNGKKISFKVVEVVPQIA